jgi:hypothetical protein
LWPGPQTIERFTARIAIQGTEALVQGHRYKEERRQRRSGTSMPDYGKSKQLLTDIRPPNRAAGSPEKSSAA